MSDAATQIEEALLGSGGLTEAELSERLGITLSAVGNGLRNLVREGYVENYREDGKTVWRLT